MQDNWGSHHSYQSTISEYNFYSDIVHVAF